MPKCSICQLHYDGFGNNAYPVNDGRCCNTCNDVVVIPARFAQVYRMESQRKAALSIYRQVKDKH